MPTFEETFGAAEAQRIARDSFGRVTGVSEGITFIDLNGTLRDCGITTPSQCGRLLFVVDSEVRERGFRMNPEYLRILNYDSDVSSLVQTILMSLPGDEDFGEGSENEVKPRSPFTRKRPRR